MACESRHAAHRFDQVDTFYQDGYTIIYKNDYCILLTASVPFPRSVNANAGSRKTNATERVRLQATKAPSRNYIPAAATSR